jgi:hypothetical protein
MQITKNSLETAPGPSDWFTGAVYLDTVAIPLEPSRLAPSSVHFTPGARTAWHTHPFGQTIYVMTHLAMQEVDDQGSPVTWGEHVTDEEYSATPST